MKSIQDIIELVIKAGDLAAARQKQIKSIEREFKTDGSVVTEVDRLVEDLLCEQIARIFPQVNFITEERARAFNEECEFTFVIDPIDGTDSFSGGSPVWAVSVALCDNRLSPIAGIVYAPRLDSLFIADIGQQATLNSIPLQNTEKVRDFDLSSTLLLHPYAHRDLNLRNFVGKVRCFGSTALHLCFPAAISTVVGALGDPRVKIWDIAAAHAISSASGCDFCYFDGHSVDYKKMKSNNWKVLGFLSSTKPGALNLLQNSVFVN